MRRAAALVAVVVLLAACGASSSFKGDYVRCQVTAKGLAERSAHGVADADQLDAAHAKVGEQYQSYSGCITGDKSVD